MLKVLQEFFFRPPDSIHPSWDTSHRLTLDDLRQNDAAKSTRPRNKAWVGDGASDEKELLEGVITIASLEV